MNAITGHLESLGHLTASLQVPYARLLKAVDALGIRAAFVINGVAHFDESQCEAIAAHVSKASGEAYESRTKLAARLAVSPRAIADVAAAINVRPTYRGGTQCYSANDCELIAQHLGAKPEYLVANDEGSDAT